jgi:hypothetical protein
MQIYSRKQILQAGRMAEFPPAFQMKWSGKLRMETIKLLDFLSFKIFNI